jgi:hypothetical protein
MADLKQKIQDLCSRASRIQDSYQQSNLSNIGALVIFSHKLQSYFKPRGANLELSKLATIFNSQELTYSITNNINIVTWNQTHHTPITETDGARNSITNNQNSWCRKLKNDGVRATRVRESWNQE